MMIDLRQIPTPMLLEIRNILKYGVTATAETKKAKELRQLQAENERLKKLNERRGSVEDAGLDWDADYWMAFDDKSFNYFLKLFADQQAKVEREVALSERTCSMRIPPMISRRELSAIDAIRQGFLEHKHGNRYRQSN